MAYLKRWRKYQAEVLTLAEGNNSDMDEANVLVGASVASMVHDRVDTDSSCHMDGRNQTTLAM